jgi:hypothetical protein
MLHVRQIQQPAIEQRYQSNTKRKWNDQEKHKLLKYTLDNPTAICSDVSDNE